MNKKSIVLGFILGFPLDCPFTTNSKTCILLNNITLITAVNIAMVNFTVSKEENNTNIYFNEWA